MRLTPEAQSQIAGSRAEVHEDVASRGSTVSTKSKAKGKAVYIFISRALLSSGVQKLSAETETSGGARLAPASGASSLSCPLSSLISVSCPLSSLISV